MQKAAQPNCNLLCNPLCNHLWILLATPFLACNPTLTEHNTFAHPSSRRRAPILASSKLRNRRSAEHGVRGFLSNVVISPSLAATICNGAISTTYLAYVIELNEKHKYVSSREPPKDGTSSDIAPLDTVAGKEMRSHIEKLRLKAVEKSREYFINVISEVRKVERERERWSARRT